MKNRVDSVLQNLYKLQMSWRLKQDQLIELSRNGVMPTNAELEIWLPGCNSVIDYGLITNEEIFMYKLPELLIQLWRSEYQQCVNLQQDTIDYQIKKAKTGGISDQELKYTASIMNLISWVLKHKFGLSQGQRRIVTSGDLKRQTHFTVKKGISQ